MRMLPRGKMPNIEVQNQSWQNMIYILILRSKNVFTFLDDNWSSDFSNASSFKLNLAESNSKVIWNWFWESRLEDIRYLKLGLFQNHTKLGRLIVFVCPLTTLQGFRGEAIAKMIFEQIFLYQIARFQGLSVRACWILLAIKTLLRSLFLYFYVFEKFQQYS